VYDDGVVLHVGGREFTEVQLRSSQAPTSFEPTPAEASRKFVVFRTENHSAIYPGTVPARSQVIRSLWILAAPGQYEPVVSAVFALRPLGRVTATPGPLAGPAGATIAETAFDARMGRHVIQRVGYTSADCCAIPKLLVKSAEVGVAPERPQLYWLTLHVPPEAPAGNYRGIDGTLRALGLDEEHFGMLDPPRPQVHAEPAFAVLLMEARRRPLAELLEVILSPRLARVR
jgi:hypothetical protein